MCNYSFMKLLKSTVLIILQKKLLKRSRTCTYLYDLSGNFNVLLTYESHLGKYKPEGLQNMSMFN